MINVTIPVSAQMCGEMSGTFEPDRSTPSSINHQVRKVEISGIIQMEQITATNEQS